MDGAAVLVNHDPAQHVGVVEHAWIGDDRIGRAKVRFGTNDDAERVFRDVRDGIRNHISFGARIHDDDVTRADNGTFHIQDWEPTEISFASVPADHSVGVGRTLKVEDNMPPDENTPIVTPLDVERARKDAADETTKRVTEMMDFGESYKCPDFASEAIKSGMDMQEFKRKAFDLYRERAEAELNQLETAKPVTNLGLSDGEVQRFSICRAISAVIEGRFKEDAPFEYACSEEISRTIDRQPSGLFVPHDVQTRAYSQFSRAMTTTATDGGEYVGTEHRPQDFIDTLRNAVVAIQAGARMLTGLNQNLSIPKKTSNTGFSWLAESGTVTPADHVTAAVTLSPKTVGGATQASRRLVKQALPAIDDLIMQDLVAGAAETIDLGILEGTGMSNQPTGIENTSGVNTEIVTTANQPDWTDVVNFENALAVDNALTGSLAWVVASPWVSHCKVTEKSSGSGRFIMEAEANSIFGPRGTLNGYPVFVTNAITTGVAQFGNWSECLVGMWGVLDLRPDPYTLANQDGLTIWAFQDVDVAVRHPESFCVRVAM